MQAEQKKGPKILKPACEDQTFWQTVGTQSK